MSDEKHESPGHGLVEEYTEAVDNPGPMRMQLISTWEVRKVPVNCVSRLCVLTVTRLEIVRRSIDSGQSHSHGSIVLAVAMKSPHRFLRSNEIEVPASGVLNIPVQLTFSLQYPHFLKRGGNVLQIRIQRRKRYRNRPLGGYKTLAMGKVDMSQVLQHSFQGEVKLYTDKVPEHLAVVTISSLVSTAVDVDRSHLAEVSSEEDEDDIFSDDLVERGTDSDSGDNEQAQFVVPHKGKKFKPSLAVLRLLRLNRRSKRGHHAMELVTTYEEEELRGSAVTFASSPSDSDDEEFEIEGAHGGTPPRPTLSPFFGSDRCSMVSLPTSAKSAEAYPGRKTDDTPMASLSSFSKRYGSLEQAISTGLVEEIMDTPPPPAVAVPDGEEVDEREWDISKERVWCVMEGMPGCQAVVGGLEREGEVVARMGGDGGEQTNHNGSSVVKSFLSLMAAVWKKRRDLHPLVVVLVGGDEMVSAAVQALVSTGCSPELLKFVIIPTVPGLMAARLASLDDEFLSSFPLDGHWVAGLQDSIDPLLEYVQAASHSLSLSLAQAVVQRPAAADLTGAAAPVDQCIPFMCNVSVGAWELDAEPGSSTNLPTSPTTSSESPELMVEYWSAKKEGQKSHQGSVKVRSIIVSCASHMLNVTATKDKKGKGIRIRKKDIEPGSSIVSLTASQLTCRPTSKQESVTVVIDGVEWEGVSLVKLLAGWEHSSNNTFSIAVSSSVGEGVGVGVGDSLPRDSK